MQICELSLEETGLSRKKGAEILAQEFEQVCSVTASLLLAPGSLPRFDFEIRFVTG